MSEVAPQRVPAELQRDGQPHRLLDRVPVMEYDNTGRRMPTGDTELLIDVLVRMVRAGATVADACNAVSPPISKSSYFGWQKKGRILRERMDNGLDDGANATQYELLCLEFLDRCKAAENEAKVEALQAVRRAFVGFDEVETTTTTVETPVTIEREVVDEKTGAVRYVQDIEMVSKTTTTVKRGHKFQWQAAMTWLERRYGAEYARRFADTALAASTEDEHEMVEHEQGRALELLDQLDELREKRAIAEAADTLDARIGHARDNGHDTHTTTESGSDSV